MVRQLASMIIYVLACVAPALVHFASAQTVRPRMEQSIGPIPPTPQIARDLFDLQDAPVVTRDEAAESSFILCSPMTEFWINIGQK